MSQKKFFELLEQVPRIKHLWDKHSRSLNIELFERELGVMSSGEVCMAKFFASVWFGNNERYGFDFVDAVAWIDTPERKLIVEWVRDPFWP